jgi:hypothetical protein
MECTVQNKIQCEQGAVPSGREGLRNEGRILKQKGQQRKSVSFRKSMRNILHVKLDAKSEFCNATIPGGIY